MRSQITGYFRRFVMSAPRCHETCPGQRAACAFQVAWSINPHMRVGSVHGRHAVRQHGVLVRTLEALGATVDVVPFVHGAFDSVFSKDNAVLVAREPGGIDALLAAPRHAERQLEQRARAHALEDLGIHVQGAARLPLEGGDVVMLPRASAAFLGHGFRSDRRATRELERFLARPVLGIELRDPRLYHLDMALSVLDDGTALVCAEALTRESLRAVLAHPEVRDVIYVPLHEAMRFGVNLVQLGHTVVWGADAPQTAGELEARGYRVQHVELGQFHLAGGSAACLVSRVHCPSAADLDVMELDDAPQSSAA